MVVCALGRLDSLRSGLRWFESDHVQRWGGHGPLWWCRSANHLTQPIFGSVSDQLWAKALLHLEPAAATPVGAANLLGGVVVFVVWTLHVETLGKTPSLGPPVRMMAAQPASRPFLKASSLGSIWLLCGSCFLKECWWWWCGRLGSTVVCVAAALFSMCSSSVVFPGFGHVVVHVQVPPLVAIVVR
uniref:Uncharacterized protein n=1 Tax=Triticum urartu TaxID=4572 RepID=A0A8R7NZE7_TRIUA